MDIPAGKVHFGALKRQCSTLNKTRLPLVQTELTCSMILFPLNAYA